MQTRNLAIALLAFLSAAPLCRAETVDGEFLVKFKRLPQNDLAGDLGGAEVDWVVPERNIALIRPGPARIPNGDVLDRLRGRRDVELVQPNFAYRATLFIDKRLARQARAASPFDLLSMPATSNDPLLSQDKDLELADVKPAWDIEKGSRDVVVAVIDTGVDYNHEDLAANMWHDPSDPKIVGWNFVDNDSNPFDVTGPVNVFTGAGNPGHGTHCAGNIGAVGDNGVGTSGVAQRVSIMALRMLNQDGRGETAAGIKAIDWAVAHGARIISASWGSEGTSDDDELLKQAIARAETKGVLFVAAAGNTQPGEQKDADNDSNPARRTFPASFELPNILSVAASGRDGKMANFTHFGAKSVHLAAPGERSFSTIPANRSTSDYPGSNRYEEAFQIPVFGTVPWDGTSMATPQVAGAAALLAARHPEWNYAQLKKRLMDTVRPEPTFQGKSVTGGVLDVAAALKE